MLIVGLEGQPYVHFHHVVAADQRAAAATRQHLALERRPVEAAALKMKDASAAIRSGAKNGYLNFEGAREQQAGVDLWHEGPRDDRHLPCAREFYCRTFRS